LVCKAKRWNLIHWTEPTNIGEPITDQYDALLFISAAGDYAHFISSNNFCRKERYFRLKLEFQPKPETPVNLLLPRQWQEERKTRIMYSQRIQNLPVLLVKWLLMGNGQVPKNSNYLRRFNQSERIRRHPNSPHGFIK
jgi:hypothetical protein